MSGGGRSRRGAASSGRVAGRRGHCGGKRQSVICGFGLVGVWVRLGIVCAVRVGRGGGHRGPSRAGAGGGGGSGVGGPRQVRVEIKTTDCSVGGGGGGWCRGAWGGGGLGLRGLCGAGGGGWEQTRPHPYSGCMHEAGGRSSDLASRRGRGQGGCAGSGSGGGASGIVVLPPVVGGRSVSVALSGVGVWGWGGGGGRRGPVCLLGGQANHNEPLTWGPTPREHKTNTQGGHRGRNTNHMRLHAHRSPAAPRGRQKGRGIYPGLVLVYILCQSVSEGRSVFLGPVRGKRRPF